VADDDQTALNDEEQSFLLSGSSSLDGVDFQAASGLNAGNIARTVIGTIGLAFGTAATVFVGGVGEAWTSILDALAAFVGGTRELVTGVGSNLAPGRVYRNVPGLIGTVADSWASAMRGAWSSALPDSGIAAWLFSLGIVLLTFYAAARGLDELREVL
jgi:hypothetical protein